jgi:hypothetical protein
MFKLFNKSFLSFLVGFVAIIAISFVLIVTASAYSGGMNASSLGLVSKLFYTVFIR